MSDTTITETPAATGGRAKQPPCFGLAAGKLRAALKGATDVVEARNTIPVLSNLKLTAAHGRLTIEGTDLDLWVVRHLDVDQDVGTPEFCTTISASTLKAIVAKLPADDIVTLTLRDAGRVTVASGRARFTLPTLPVEDFPSLTGPEMPHRFEMPAMTMVSAIAASRFAASTEETRYYLGGLFVHAPTLDDGQVLRIAATDGHRLARVTLPLPDGAGSISDAIIPTKAVKLIESLLDGHEGNFEMALGAARVAFDLGDITVTAKLIDGSFPDYTRVIPSGNDKTASIARAALVSATERVRTLASEKTSAIKLAFERDKVTLSVASPENGTATEEVPCDFDGAPIEIGFNARYLIEVVGHVQGETVELVMAEPAAPTIVRDVNDAAPVLYVLMPMRV
ncbi:MAG: DNA polymerase III subunit beta [Sphingomonadales bacterium]|nr:DNA polymerase III subunit beta [Sphingomonadales bacterium]